MKSVAHQNLPSPMPDPGSASDTSSIDPEHRSSLRHTVRRWLKFFLGIKPDASLKEVVEEVMEEHEGEADPEEKVILHNVLSFGDLYVSDIMIPRADIIAVPHDISLNELKKHIIEHRHTRIPVYEDTLDRVLGFLHIKDLLPMLADDKPYDVKSVLRKLLFVPPSKRIIDLLVGMRNVGSHMAIVVDEYGGTDGLVTMEDLFERIVGDIYDEHDADLEQADRIIRAPDGTFEVSARIPIRQLQKELHLTLISEEKASEFDTLGGLIFFHLGRVPAKGEIVPYGAKTQFQIMEADSRRIRRVRIRII